MHFDLRITADTPSRVAELYLRDTDGNQLAYHRTDFKQLPVGEQRGLFDLRDYLRHYARGREAEAVAELGVLLAEKVLGEEIFRHLYKAATERTLRIQLPGADSDDNHLAAALARVPWEIARPAKEKDTLAKRNLLIRVVHDMDEPDSTPLALDGEELRVLLVFAEARGSRPLDARRERLALLKLFEKEIYPRRRVVAHVLSHGVTRERLREQIADHGGYHIVHWSGHGHRNLLELARPGGGRDHLSGEDLVALFEEAGGLQPRLFFLGACHSGDILRISDWEGFLTVARGGEPGTRAPDVREIDLTPRPGYTGTAHALLQSGVPSVVAMRYAVGDDYARDLAVEFYRRLLADPRPKTIAAALTAARKALRDPKRHDLARYLAADHATPVLYGEGGVSLAPANGRSSGLDDVRDRRLPRIAELSLDAHEHFVGRTWELADLGAGVIGTRDGAEVEPVAVVTGLGGMGKTALVAEALALWETRFQWVLLFQAKPNPLAFDPALRQIDERLRGELSRYLEHVQRWPAAAIHRDAAEGFRGPERLDRLTDNLLRAMRDEAILLVLDNFETNLKPEPEPGAQGWACQDPAWDRCLARLATELVGTQSRVLITCRRPLAALVGTPSHPVPLGPLPAGEAALFLRDHPRLGAMVFGGDPNEKALAKRLLRASRFHPLLMDRLARLTMDPGLRPQLLAALEALERTGEHAKLPELFATRADDDDERRYLEDALAASIDALLAGAPVEARRVLWMIATANEPVALGLLRSVWSGESHEQQQLREFKAMLDLLPGLPAELQAQLRSMPAELRGMLDALPEVPAVPELMPALEHLVSVGLVTEERQGPDDENPDLGCHEVVRERIRGWVEAHPEDLGAWTESALRLAYADRLAGVFKGLQHQNMALALEAGSRALVYAVQAGDYDRLGRFASGVVTGSRDPRLMTRLLPHLQAAADAAPEGRLRWNCLCYLADAVRLGGRPDASLSFFAEAAAQARAVAEADGDDARQAWADLAVITGNWAHALGNVGQLGAARQRNMDSAEAERKAGRPAVNVLGSELEALRIDIMQGKVEEALPEVESRLSQIETWWTQHREGKPVPEAPDAEDLARALISALDIAVDAHFARRAWKPALERIDAILEVERALHRPDEDIASTRVNRANVLGRLQRFGEAQIELEACLELFQNHPANRAAVLSSLADLFDKQGDRTLAIDQERRALALRNTLPDPHARAISHNNLSNYLQREGKPEGLAEAPRHQLAALLYCLVADLRESLRISLHNYAVAFRRAHTTGTPPAIPTVADLLADPTFDALAEWLRQRDVELSELQTAVDQLLGHARRTAMAGT